MYIIESFPHYAMPYDTLWWWPLGAFHLVRTHLGGGGGSSFLYISIAYYMQKGGRGPDSM